MPRICTSSSFLRAISFAQSILSLSFSRMNRYNLRSFLQSMIQINMIKEGIMYNFYIYHLSQLIETFTQYR